MQMISNDENILLNFFAEQSFDIWIFQKKYKFRSSAKQHGTAS